MKRDFKPFLSELKICKNLRFLLYMIWAVRNCRGDYCGTTYRGEKNPNSKYNTPISEYPWDEDKCEGKMCKIDDDNKYIGALSIKC